MFLVIIPLLLLVPTMLAQNITIEAMTHVINGTVPDKDVRILTKLINIADTPEKQENYCIKLKYFDSTGKFVSLPPPILEHCKEFIQHRVALRKYIDSIFAELPKKKTFTVLKCAQLKSLFWSLDRKLFNEINAVFPKFRVQMPSLVDSSKKKALTEEVKEIEKSINTTNPEIAEKALYFTF